MSGWICNFTLLSQGHIDNHLVPFFGDRDLRDLRESDILEFIQAKHADGLKPATIKNALSILRRVVNLLIRDDQLSRNPLSNLGELIRRVATASASETEEILYWNDDEIETLLRIAREKEPRFAPLLIAAVLHGNASGRGAGPQLVRHRLRGKLHNCSAVYHTGRYLNPQERKEPPSRHGTELCRNPIRSTGRTAARGDEPRARGEVSEWVFTTKSGKSIHPRNVNRTWERVRRRAQKEGVRPLKLHCARHTWATRALEAGRNIRWVADQLGHADPSLTLRVYAHAVREGETDLSFADFGGPKRPYTAPAKIDADVESRNSAKTNGDPGAIRTHDPQLRRLVELDSCGRLWNEFSNLDSTSVHHYPPALLW